MDTDWLASDCYYVDKRDRIAKIIGHLRGDRAELPIIEDQGRPYAIVDPRAIMRRGLRQDMAVEKVSWPVPKIQNGDTVAKTLERFAASGATHLPAYLGRPPRKAGYLDAATFLQEAFTDGPDATAAAQGLPALWPDASIEDAIQSFAASPLPSLPVVGKNGIEGAVQRQDLLPYLEQGNGSMGRRDKAGNRDDVRDDPIDAIIGPRPAMIRADADFAAVQAALIDNDCLFIEHGTVEAITAASMLQALQAAKQRPAAPQHFRQAKARI